MKFFDRLKQETATERAAYYAVPAVIDGYNGNVTLPTYLAYLEQAYHHVKNTLPLLLLMASRIPKEKEWIRRAIVKYTAEEVGHDEWILDDIRNSGGDAEAVRNSKPSLPIELVNAFNYDFITRRNPLGYFGMIVVLENASVDQATQTRLDNMQKALGLGPECFSYLSSHGALDIEHTQFIGDLLNTITDPQDQEDIIHATKVIYHLYADMCRGLPHQQARKVA